MSKCKFVLYSSGLANSLDLPYTHELCQAHPQNDDEIFGGIPTIFFGAFGQLPHVGDSLVYSDKPSAYHSALHVEGHHMFEAFKQSEC